MCELIVFTLKLSTAFIGGGGEEGRSRKGAYCLVNTIKVAVF